MDDKPVPDTYIPKPPRDVSKVKGELWNLPKHRNRCLGVEVVGDNRTVVEWMNGKWSVNQEKYQIAIGSMIRAMGRLWGRGCIVLRVPQANWLRHHVRELNK